MKVHHQFDLNLSFLRQRNFSGISKNINENSIQIEKLIQALIGRGYMVIESSPRYMGIPQSITIIKDLTGPFVVRLSSKVQDDFKAISSALGIEKLFE